MPKVTVITPNYNHARYLAKRIESVLNQTFQDFELIILDDASTDNSREIIESYAKDPRVKLILNPDNSGSTFKQWNLGLSHARGEYVWFAESDDYADPSLLETLVDRLDRHPNIGLAYCQSLVVDQDNNILFNYINELGPHIQTDRWRADYVNSGHEECINFMLLHNTIPNASAVLLRRQILVRAGGAPRDMQLCGDWMTYINVLSLSDIAFVSAPLNCFRQHRNTVRSRYENQELSLGEVQKVHRALIKRFGRRRLFRDGDKTLIAYLGVFTSAWRRPQRYELSPGRALGLLMWYAWIHPRAFRIALPWLLREQMSDLIRRAGLSRVAHEAGHASATKASE